MTKPSHNDYSESFRAYCEMGLAEQLFTLAQRMRERVDVERIKASLQAASDSRPPEPASPGEPPAEAPGDPLSLLRDPTEPGGGFIISGCRRRPRRRRRRGRRPPPP